MMAVGRSLIANPDWCSLVSANPGNAGIVHVNKIYETCTYEYEVSFSISSERVCCIARVHHVSITMLHIFHSYSVVHICHSRGFLQLMW